MHATFLALCLFSGAHSIDQQSSKGSVSAANKTILGPNVFVFEPGMPSVEIERTAHSIFQKMEANQFGQDRFAMLFKPGRYDATFNVGFYTHVAGLGLSPDDVSINGGVNVNAKWADGLALNNFWRTLENFSVTPSSDIPFQTLKGVTRIAVSQAAPLRRLHVKGELQLFDWGSKGNVGYASGGFLADSIVDGKVVPGSQQQWLARNCSWGGWNNAVWNMVFVGCQNAPLDSFPEPPYTVIKQTPLIREKPFLHVDHSGKFAVFVPSLRATSQGVSWAPGPADGRSVEVDKFYIAKPATASSAELNKALASGKNLLFTPGIYRLDDTLRVSRPGTILLGIGVPSLIPTTGKSAISVADVSDVSLAGLIIDAGETASPVLLEIGPPNSKADHSLHPTFLYDLTVRTGGPKAGKNDKGVVINSNDVVVDHIWIWRADHGQGVGWTTNPTTTGLQVNGNRVTAYGLFNEHHQQYQTLWNGDNGRVYMYQSEMPYDVPNQAAWMSSGKPGYASYKVADDVKNHEAWGLGVYCFFRDAPIRAQNAIEAPAASGVRFHNLTTIWLDGQLGSEISHIINNQGGKVTKDQNGKTVRQTLKESSPTKF